MADVRTPLLEVRNLKKYFPISRRVLGRGETVDVRAVDDVSFDVFAGETLGLVGESGCGKSTLARCIVRLYQPTAGTITFAGRDITGLSARALRPLRRELQMVFQDVYGSLNPKKKVGRIIGDPLRIHHFGSEEKIRKRVRELLQLVGLSPEHYSRYPSEFSGGQRQRIGVARALALSPRLVVADEPVSALDVSIQAQVVNLLTDLQDELSLTYVFVAHDLAVVRQVSDRVAVMYLGRIVETSPADDLYAHPIHPYTEALLSAVPSVDPDVVQAGGRVILDSDVSSPIDIPSGCRFHPRCRYATDICRTVDPQLENHGADHWAACHHPLNDGAGAKESEWTRPEQVPSVNDLSQ
jgi:oligopeptide/dipeptide ABC transporter ATP-binding protein